MTKITIASRFHPFSHEIGTKFLLPYTTIVVQVFPTHLQFIDIDNKISAFSIDFSFQGPLKEWTAELDLEHGYLRVFGKTQEGYMCYRIKGCDEGLELIMEKVPLRKVECRCSYLQNPLFLLEKEKLSIPWSGEKILRIATEERLSLGMHKAQNWESIRTRFDFKEIFPLWCRLSMGMPMRDLPVEEKEGNYALLKICRQRIENREKNLLIEAFENLFLAAFEGVLVPRLFDTEYQGILNEVKKTNREISPLPLLIESGKLIRSLFFLGKQEEIAILPCLPSSFHCGRMIGAKDSRGNIFDFEWTKKDLRRLRLTSFSEGEIHLQLPKGIVSCRFKKGHKAMGQLPLNPKGKMTLFLKANEVVHLDRFLH